jgi:hypothetical protein
LTAAASGGSGPYTYTWSTGDSGATIDVRPTETTTYTVMAASSSNERAQARVTVNVKEQPAIAVKVKVDASSERAAPGGSVTLTAKVSSGTAPYTYQWSTGQIGESIAVRPAKTKTYKVTVTDAAAQTGTAQTTIAVNCQLTVVIDGPGTVEQTPTQQTTFEPGESVTLKATPLTECDEFLGWEEGGQVVSTHTEVIAVMSTDREITAVFDDGEPIPGPCFGPGGCAVGLMAMGFWLVGRPGRARAVLA